MAPGLTLGPPPDLRGVGACWGRENPHVAPGNVGSGAPALGRLLPGPLCSPPLFVCGSGRAPALTPQSVRRGNEGSRESPRGPQDGTWLRVTEELRAPPLALVPGGHHQHPPGWGPTTERRFSELSVLTVPSQVSPASTVPVGCGGSLSWGSLRPVLRALTLWGQGPPASSTSVPAFQAPLHAAAPGVRAPAHGLGEPCWSVTTLVSPSEFGQRGGGDGRRAAGRGGLGSRADGGFREHRAARPARAETGAAVLVGSVADDRRPGGPCPQSPRSHADRQLQKGPRGPGCGGRWDWPGREHQPHHSELSPAGLTAAPGA